MIKSVKVINHKGEELLMNLKRPENFAITDITGIDPVKATINTTELSLADGSVFNSAKKQQRNIVFQFRILPWSTVEQSRHVLYKFFPIKKLVTLIFYTDTRNVKTTGYVESNEIKMFANDRKDGETAQVSIICPRSDFYSEYDEIANFNSYDSAFSFPFSNPTTGPELVLGNIRQDNYITVYYEGEANVGMTFYMRATNVVSNIQILDLTRQTSILLDSSIIAQITGSDISANDEIVLCTERGQKSIYLIRAGQTYNILPALGINTTWFELEPGENTYLLRADVGATNIKCDIYYHTVYEGI